MVWERVAGVQLPNEQLAWRLALLERAQAEISQVVDDENLQSRLAAVIAGASLISKVRSHDVALSNDGLADSATDLEGDF